MSSHARSRLLDVARRLLEDGGPDALTMDALAEAAGVSRATIYRHAGSREAIIAALADEGVDVGPRAPAREAILAACRVVFGRQGFERATLEEISAEAGVGVATLYRHFGDRDGLIAAFAGSIGGRAALRELPATCSGDLRADLLLLVGGLLTSMTRDHDLMRLGLVEMLSGSGRLPLAGQRTGSVHERVERLMGEYMALGVLPPGDPAQLAVSLIGPVMAITVIVPHARPELRFDVETLAPTLVDQFLYGALAARSKE